MISRDKTRRAVERAIAATDPKERSLLCDTAWIRINQLSARGAPKDIDLANQLAEKLISANRAQP